MNTRRISFRRQLAALKYFVTLKVGVASSQAQDNVSMSDPKVYGEFFVDSKADDLLDDKAKAKDSIILKFDLSGTDHIAAFQIPKTDGADEFPTTPCGVHEPLGHLEAQGKDISNIIMCHDIKGKSVKDSAGDITGAGNIEQDPEQRSK